MIYLIGVVIVDILFLLIAPVFMDFGIGVVAFILLGLLPLAFYKKVSKKSILSVNLIISMISVIFYIIILLRAKKLMAIGEESILYIFNIGDPKIYFLSILLFNIPGIIFYFTYKR